MGEAHDEGAEIFCTSCSVGIHRSEASHHYGSQWHRYNVKRKAAGHAPLPKDLFEQKLAEVLARKEPKKKEPVNIRCEISGKRFRSVAAYEQHRKSKKYIKALKRAEAAAALQAANPTPVDEATDDKVEDAGDMSDEVEDIPEPIPVGTCFFSGRYFKTLEKCMTYMTKEYGFFVPYIEHCVDMVGFIEFLGAKVGLGRTCLYCGRQFSSLPGLRRHMIDKSHCKLDWDEDADEYDQFFDFSAVPMEEDGDQKNTLATKEPPRRITGMTDTGELQRSDGTIIGTRELRNYYRQSPRIEDTRDSVVVSRLMAQYRALSLPGYNPKENYNQVTKTVRRRADKWRLRMGLKNNHIKIKHFVDQTGCLKGR